jgi:hypothetical protein
VGAALPEGQKTLTSPQGACVGEVEPAGQYEPAEQLPEHAAVVMPALPPKRPAAHCVQLACEPSE